MKNKQPINILIADDDKVIADIFKDLLTSENRSVETCHDGRSAVEMLQQGNVDLLMADLVMPEMGGLEVLKHAKKINPDIIVIIVTGYASLETAVAAIKEGAYDYIIKPCKLDEIRIVINRAIEKIRLHKENRELLKKLQDAYRDLVALDMNKPPNSSKGHDFVSSNLAGLHHLYDNPDQDCVDKLQVLSNLKDTGAITEFEFKEFKLHYLKTIAMGN
jgi:CheY-like chemotaxis protein